MPRNSVNHATQKIGRLGSQAIETLLRDDSPKRSRFVSVGGQRLVGFEMHIAFDGEAERTAEVTDFVHTDEAELLGPSMALALRARLRRFKTALPF